MFDFARLGEAAEILWIKNPKPKTKESAKIATDFFTGRMMIKLTL